MRSLLTANSVVTVALVVGGCILVERPPGDWPEPETDTPTDYAELQRRCRQVAMQRGTKANHAIRTETVLTWAGGASLAGGAVTATLAGLDSRQREGVIGAAVVTTISAGVALGARFVAPAADQRQRYVATRAHEHAADQGLWRLAETTAKIADRAQVLRDARALPKRSSSPASHVGPTLAELYRYQAELHDYVLVELSNCIAVDPRPLPAPLPSAPATEARDRTAHTAGHGDLTQPPLATADDHAAK